MKRTAEWRVVEKRTGDRLKSPIAKCGNKRFLARLNDNLFGSSIRTLMLIQGLHCETRKRHRIGARSDQDVLRFEDGRKLGWAQILAVDQDFAGAKRDKGRIDVHRSAALVLQFMDAVTITGQVPAQPLETGGIRHVAANAKRSRPQRTKSAASKTGSNSVIM